MGNPLTTAAAEVIYCEQTSFASANARNNSGSCSCLNSHVCTTPLNSIKEII